MATAIRRFRLHFTGCSTITRECSRPQFGVQTLSRDDNSDFDPEWWPKLDHGGAYGEINETMINYYSIGDERKDPVDTTLTLLGKLGEYDMGPHTEATMDFTELYHDQNWHCKSWELLFQNAFARVELGATFQHPNTAPSSIECVKLLWIAKIQKKLVQESNAYANWIDP